MSFWTSPSGYALSLITTELVILTIFIIVVLFVPARSTVIRAASAFALTALSYALNETLLWMSSDIRPRTLVNEAIICQHISACEIIWVSRLDSVSISGRNELPQSTAGPIAQAFSLLPNMRRVGTRWQVKNIATTSNSELSRPRFVLRRLTKVILAYLILDIITSGPPPNLELMSSGKDTLVHFSSLSTGDIAFRTIGSAAFWLTLFLAITIQSEVVASFFILTGLSSPKDAPPTFGSFVDAYTLRGLWGSFWHQWLRKFFTGLSDFIADSVLQLRRGRKLSRYTRLFFVFAISGIYHRAADITVGIPRAETGSVKFFLLQPLGIMLEDGAQALFASRIKSSRVRRMIGSFWVAVFLIWSTPIWFYPTAKFGPKPDVMLPIHVRDFLKF